ncbi:hypothetical protein P8452_17281 [Trifolium repens]|nr:hypothetical protein P8452_17281 [Trifolium repens]
MHPVDNFAVGGQKKVLYIIHFGNKYAFKCWKLVAAILGTDLDYLSCKLCFSASSGDVDGTFHVPISGGFI